MSYRATVYLDPPRPSDDELAYHDFVELVVESSGRRNVEWFLEYVKDRIVCHYGIEEVNDE